MQFTSSCFKQLFFCNFFGFSNGFFSFFSSFYSSEYLSTHAFTSKQSDRVPVHVSQVTRKVEIGNIGDRLADGFHSEPRSSLGKRNVSRNEAKKKRKKKTTVFWTWQPKIRINYFWRRWLATSERRNKGPDPIVQLLSRFQPVLSTFKANNAPLINKWSRWNVS